MASKKYLRRSQICNLKYRKLWIIWRFHWSFSQTCSYRRWHERPLNLYKGLLRGSTTEGLGSSCKLVRFCTSEPAEHRMSRTEGTSWRLSSHVLGITRPGCHIQCRPQHFQDGDSTALHSLLWQIWSGFVFSHLGLPAHHLFAILSQGEEVTWVRGASPVLPVIPPAATVTPDYQSNPPQLAGLTALYPNTDIGGISFLLPQARFSAEAAFYLARYQSNSTVALWTFRH